MKKVLHFQIEIVDERHDFIILFYREFIDAGNEQINNKVTTF